MIQTIDDLLTRGMIQKSTSHYASPAYPVIKKDGSVRLVIDYRKLNEKMIEEVFPFPNIEDILSGLEGCDKFSSIDLLQGYFQINMDAD